MEAQIEGGIVPRIGANNLKVGPVHDDVVSVPVGVRRADVNSETVYLAIEAQPSEEEIAGSWADAEEMGPQWQITMLARDRIETPPNQLAGDQ